MVEHPYMNENSSNIRAIDPKYNFIDTLEMAFSYIDEFDNGGYKGLTALTENELKMFLHDIHKRQKFSISQKLQIKNHIVQHIIDFPTMTENEVIEVFLRCCPDVPLEDVKKRNLQQFEKWQYLKPYPKSYNDFVDYILNMSIEDDDLDESLVALFSHINPKSMIFDQVISKLYTHFRKTIGRKRFLEIAKKSRISIQTFEFEPPEYEQRKLDYYEKKFKQFDLTREEVAIWCKDFLRKPPKERIEEIDKVLRFYITREKNNRILLYFFLLCNYNPELMSIILYRGDPSSGKSFIIKYVARLFPKYKIAKANTMTDQSIKYDDSMEGCNTLIIREMFENQNTLMSFLKAWYDNKKVVHKYVEKRGEKHQTITETKDRFGAVATFSFEHIQNDLIDRSIVFNPDQTDYQTEKIIDKAIQDEGDSITRIFKEMEIKKLQFLIGETVNYLDFFYNVRIVFANKFLRQLFPKTIPRKGRRDKDKIKNLIRIITLWNQYNRKTLTIGEKKFIWAEFEDIEIALRYFQDLFHFLVSDIDLIKGCILDAMNKKEAYKITEIFNHLHDNGHDISRDTVKRKLFDLADASYLEARKLENNRWVFEKLKGTDITKELSVDSIKAEITEIVEKDYNKYKNKSYEDVMKEVEKYEPIDAPEPEDKKTEPDDKKTEPDDKKTEPVDKKTEDEKTEKNLRKFLKRDDGTLQSTLNINQEISEKEEQKEDDDDWWR